MNEIIRVTTNENDEQLVSGRELHEFLEVGTKYEDWFPRMTEYGFEENRDFHTLKVENVARGRVYHKTDHALSLGMAKEISMIQRNEKGKQARQYFIQLEKFWNSPEMVTKRALEFQQKKIEVLQLENEAMKPKALFADAVSGSTNSCLVKDLSVLLKQNGIDIGQNRLFKYLRGNGYLGKGKGHYNKPTQRSLDQGLFEYREHFHTNGNGEVETRFTPLVTGKGQTHFVNKFLNDANLT
ncbi:phage antirepressor KilAC domain-containing protein [Enterococcus sp. BWR-S5]|uniref:phage antirepressor KilAC domain-containing protein n=1 Tax=Enterococcus sp. BWR-S5 TaxID=2787714 RepID=UPI001922855E|nr:phage antirepressor KilAC domain-containing protein [Enterococcus sp. BWR-S5]MBL1223711.1 phage antirepressor KilAC domain-containing protein [Enterococcus sp. BWR-S5]